jgi:hypothetical protein
MLKARDDGIASLLRSRVVVAAVHFEITAVGEDSADILSRKEAGTSGVAFTEAE